MLRACKFWAADAHARPVTSLVAPGLAAAAAAINRARGQGPASFVSHTQRLFCSVFVTDQVISTASVCLPCVLMAPAQCDHSQRVFYFGKGKSEGDKSMKELVRSESFFF